MKTQEPLELYVADRRDDGLVTYRARRRGEAPEDPIVAFTGPPRAILEAQNRVPEFLPYRPLDERTYGFPEDGVYALCLWTVSPEALVGRDPCISWGRIEYVELYDAALGLPADLDDSDDTPRFTVDDIPRFAAATFKRG